MIQELVCEQRGLDVLNSKKHTHENQIELIQILEGEGSFLIGDALYPLRRGTVFLIDSEHVHCSVPEESAEYVRNKLFLDKSQFLRLAELAGQDAHMPSGARYVILGEEEQSRVAVLIAALNAQTCRSWSALAALCEIMKLCFAKSHEGEANESDDPILRYISEHLAEPLTLEQIADAMHFSKYHLCRIFRKKTGMTPMQYVRLRRISHAQHLLVTTEDNISEICLACGYDNFSFFCRVFRSVAEMSPSDYRKRMRESRE